MRSTARNVGIGAAALLVFAVSATPANNGEEVIFSTPGAFMTLTGNGTASTTPFGFWIWCAADAAARSRGGYQLGNACQGSMYFYALDHNATPVVGFVTEGPDGIYTMHVAQGTFPQLFKNGFTFPPPGSTYTCNLVNKTPDPKGPGNEVDASCTFSSGLGGGTGTAAVTNAVANVTGP